MSKPDTDQQAPWRWMKIQIPAAAHKQLRAKAVAQDSTLQALVLEAVLESLKTSNKKGH